MDRWIGKVAIVTGASAGIGAALVERFVEIGIKVVGIARRKEKLDELSQKLSDKKGKFYPFPGDMTKEEDIVNAFKWTKENVGPVSILINNAGIVTDQLLTEGTTSNWNNVVNLNLLAPCIANREAIRQMKESEIDGHIIDVNSVEGHRVYNLPGVNLYPASKHALAVLTETYRLELSNLGSKIKITSLSPGGVLTEMSANAIAKLSGELLEKWSDLQMLQPEDVVDAVLFILSTPKHVQISELTMQPVGAK